MSVRNYAILYGGVRKVTGGAAVGGGNQLLTTEQHALDGAEHTAASDLTRLNASTAAHGLLPKLSGLATDVLLGDGTWGSGGANTPITAALSNPPTQAELETAVGFPAAEVPGQAYIITDSDTGLGYVVWSTGEAFEFVPVVSPASDLATVALTNGLFSDFTPQVGAAAYDATSGKVFWTYMNAAGDIIVRSFDLATQATAATTLHTTLNSEGNPSGGGDSHIQPSLLIRSSDRKIVVAYCAHNGPNMYVRISSSAADVSAFAAETNIDSSLGGTLYTYPVLTEISDGIYLTCRSEHPSGNNAVWSYSKSTDNGATWTALTQLAKETGADLYAIPAKTDDDRIDFMCSNKSPFGATTPVTLSHFYLKAGGAIYQADGTEITATKPIATASMTSLFAATGSQRGNPGAIAMGADGKLRAAFRVFEAIGTEDCRYYWGIYDETWTTQEIAAAGSGSIRGTCAIESGNPSSVWYSKDDGSSVAQIHRITTPDDGLTWLDRTITDEADEQGYLAAILDAPGGMKVLWMDGYVNDSTNATITGAGFVPVVGSELQRIVALNGTALGDGLTEIVFRQDTSLYWSDDNGATWTAIGGAGALDDLSDVTITSPAENDTLRYVSGVWINDVRKYEVVTNGEDILVWEGDELVHEFTEA